MTRPLSDEVIADYSGQLSSLLAALCILTLTTVVVSKYSGYVQSFISFTCANNSMTDSHRRRSPFPVVFDLLKCTWWTLFDGTVQKPFLVSALIHEEATFKSERLSAPLLVSIYSKPLVLKTQEYIKFNWWVLVKNADFWGFPGGAVITNLPANAGDMGSSPGPGRSHMPRSK